MKKVLILLLLAALILPLCFACDSTPDPVAESSADESKEVSGPEESEYVPDIYTGDDFSGRTFTVLFSHVFAERLSEILPNDGEKDGEAMPEQINIALKERKDRLEQELGVTLEEQYHYDTSRYGGSTYTMIQNAITTALDEFQMVDICLYDLGALAQEGSLYNLYDIDNLKMTNPWWDQGFNDSVEIGGKLYFTTGDIDLNNKDATTCILFNASLFEELQLEDPYTLITSGEWTLDKVIELAKNCTDDTDGDGQITYRDKFGWAGQYDDMYSMIYGSGVRVVSDDAEGYPKMSFYNEKTDKVVTKILEFMQEKDYYISGNAMFNEFTWPMAKLTECFASGQCLFYSGTVETVSDLSDMQDEFGLAPSPKYDKEQEAYYSLVNTWGANGMAVPKSVLESDLPFVGACMDALGYYSWSKVKGSVGYNYYDVVLKYQKITTDKASAILDLVFERRGCELGAIYSVGGKMQTVYDMLITMMNAGMTSGLTSQYDANKTRFENSAAQLKEYFKNLN